MKDYLHLIGGMLAGMALLALYFFGWSALMRCHGETIKSIAPDGVNEITTEVDANGYVTSRSTTCIYVPEKYEAQSPYLPQSGDVVMLGDGVRYVVIACADWERWTNAVARLEVVAARRWENEHKTDAGRRAWHGALKKREQTEDGRGIEYTYADGFTYTEEATAAPRVPPAVRRMRESGEKRPVAAPRAEVGNGIPARLKAKREAISARPAVREVNATFAPGGKVLKVEGK